MALARVQYIQQVAGNKNFTVPFPYISRDNVIVSVNGFDVGFSWLNDTTVTVDQAPNIGDVVDVRRETEREQLLVDFHDASTITEEQLDTAARQSFFIAQEAFDATGGTLVIENDGTFSASNRRIKNIGDPLEDGDAVNARWVKDQYTSGYNAHEERVLAVEAREAAEEAESNTNSMMNQTLSARDAALDALAETEEARDTAVAAKESALSSKQSAASSASSASSSASSAASSKTSAANSASSAASSASSAANSASSAASYATSANNSQSKASLWAESPEDSPVEAGKFSAKHHALKAAASASVASTAANDAKDYRDTAYSHKNSAYASKAAAESARDSAVAAKEDAEAAAEEIINYAGLVHRASIEEAENGDDVAKYVSPDRVHAAMARFGLGTVLGGDQAVNLNDLPDDPEVAGKSGFYPRLINSGSQNAPGSGYWYVQHLFYTSGNLTQILWGYRVSDGIYWRSRYGGTWTSWAKLWHSGNDGSGSGLDADTVDGHQASEFLTRADNLNSLSNKSVARTNLGLKSGATTSITVSANDPSGGSNGDIWIKYEVD